MRAESDGSATWATAARWRPRVCRRSMQAGQSGTSTSVEASMCVDVTGCAAAGTASVCPAAADSSLASAAGWISSAVARLSAEVLHG